VNVLLPLVPAGFAVNYAHVSTIAVFCVDFIATIPSATLFSFATEEIAIRTSNNVAALLNMTFGYKPYVRMNRTTLKDSRNSLQLIMSVLLVKSRQIEVLEFSLLGSILSNLLLTSCSSFLLGGYKFKEQ
jgi:Ca2+:H+ antiporter